MSIDYNEVQRRIDDALERRDREKARDERDKQRDLDIADLKAQLGKRKEPDHDAEPKSADEDHEPVL